MSLRNKLIRLAHSKPELRKDLLPLLKVAWPYRDYLYGEKPSPNIEYIELMWNPKTQDIQVGMGGEWWGLSRSEKLKEGKNMLLHSDGNNIEYPPVFVFYKYPTVTVSGGFDGKATFNLQKDLKKQAGGVSKKAGEAENIKWTKEVDALQKLAHKEYKAVSKYIENGIWTQLRLLSEPTHYEYYEHFTFFGDGRRSGLTERWTWEIDKLGEYLETAQKHLNKMKAIQEKMQKKARNLPRHPTYEERLHDERKRNSRSASSDFSKSFDQLKKGQRIQVAMKTYAMGSSPLFDGQLHEWEVGRKSFSRRYQVASISILPVKDGVAVKPRNAMNKFKLMKRSDGSVSLAWGDMGMKLLRLVT